MKITYHVLGLGVNVWRQFDTGRTEGSSTLPRKDDALSFFGNTEETRGHGLGVCDGDSDPVGLDMKIKVARVKRHVDLATGKCESASVDLAVEGTGVDDAVDKRIMKAFEAAGFNLSDGG